ncbi:MAG: PHB depolymerase family esterase [Burkholderiales bacterium]|nr:PHB depolymerase family esterase [Burkholderiales bacterium]
MSRRIRKSTWARSFQRSLNALTRATLRAGTRAVLKATKQATRQAATKVAKKAQTPRRTPTAAAGSTAVSATAAGAGTWTSGVALGPAGARRYRLYQPPGARKSVRLPLLVMLHGCRQDAAEFARSTRLHRVAARAGFFVLYPEQDRLANAQGCWNWYGTRSGRALGEAASIVTAIDQVCRSHGADPARVAVAGLSAGASMAALLALHHPQRFSAVAMHSGIAPSTAHSPATAIGAMQGRRRPDALPVAAAGADPLPPLPPLLVIQGSADPIVRAGNGRAAAQQWADAAGAQAGTARTVQRGQRYPMTVTDFKRGGRIAARLCEVSGLGHAWSGGAPGQPYSDPKGPDASRLIWAFVLRQFRAVSPAAPG